MLLRIWKRGLSSTAGGSKMFHKIHERTIQYYLRFCNSALYSFLIKDSSSRYNPCRISHSYEQENMDKNSHCSVVCNSKKTVKNFMFINRIMSSFSLHYVNLTTALRLPYSPESKKEERIEKSRH